LSLFYFCFHPFLSSCTSAADVVSVLFKKAMRYDVQDPGNASSDRFVLSKGHAAPVLYAAWKEVGLITEPLTNLRKITSDLEGKKMREFPNSSEFF
jgi:transketolase